MSMLELLLLLLLPLLEIGLESFVGDFGGFGGFLGRTTEVATAGVEAERALFVAGVVASADVIFL